MKSVLQFVLSAIPFLLNGILLCICRPFVWKLADRTLCYADGFGFAELALPGLHPGGALFYCGRLLMTVGLLDGWFLVPFLFLQGLISWMWVRAFPRADGRWTPAGAWFSLILTASAFLHVGGQVWIVAEPAYPVVTLLGFSVALGLLWAGRHLSGSLLASICCVLFIPCGLPALIPLAACRVLPAFLSAGLAVLLVPAVFDDCAVLPAVAGSQALYSGALLTPLALCPVLCAAYLFVRALRVRIPFTALEPWFPFAFPLLFLVLPANDVRPQIRMERAVFAAEWERALEEFPKNGTPLRLAFAYRVLALQRLGRLETDLFLVPPSATHLMTDSDQVKMDGEYLLYAYGLLEPARMRIMESAAQKGLQPRHLRMLGDIALLSGERALALRYYTQYARCPFRKNLVKERLERGVLPVDLVEILSFATTWREYVQTRENPPFFHFEDQNVERFIYGRMLQVRSFPPPNVARMLLAAYLLQKDKEAFLRNVPILDALCPEGPWPRIWQEGILASLQQLSPDEQQAAAGRLRAGALSDACVTRFESFAAVCGTAAAENRPEDETVEILRRNFSDTFWFYDLVVK